MTVTQTLARHLPADSRVLLDGDPDPWLVVSRSNQYASYTEKHGYYEGKPDSRGGHPGRTRGVHYLPEGPVTHVQIEIKRGAARNVLDVQPDDEFEVLS